MSDPTARLDGFAPIALPELVERASLLTRVDRKYLVPATELPAVLDALEPDTRILEIDGLRHFAYESVYFDTPALDSYLRAARGRRRRFKIRTRSYLDSGECYLEVKTRGARSTNVKERIDYRIEDRDRMTADGLAYVDETLRLAGIDGVALDALSPVLSTHYARTTLFLPSSGSRSTIDTRLSWTLRDDDGTDVGTDLGTDLGRRTTLDRPDVVVVETKSSSRASAVDRALWSAGHRPATLSKYGTGLAAMRAELPSNKWTRALRRSFLDTPSTPRTDFPNRTAAVEAAA